MGSAERSSKKKAQLWKKAAIHFSLCFVMGFFTGFMPTAKTTIFQSHLGSNQSEISPQPTEISGAEAAHANRSLRAETPVAVTARSSDEKLKFPTEGEEKEEEAEEESEEKLVPRRLLIVVTPTSGREEFRGALLRRLGNTLSLVAPPVVWIVVEAQPETEEVSEVLRKTKVMYRHLVMKENLTEAEAEAEMDGQRNLALTHIEHHRLSGIVHFAGLHNVYDLNFFEEIRRIEVFGTWPIALLWPNRNKAIIEGPVCDSSQVIGWHLRRKVWNETERRSPAVHISSFAFNSSILWDPERWGRISSAQDSSQNSIKFVKQEVLEDETNLKGIPPEDCSKIMLWHLHFPTPN
ncbi:beta-1,4-xylosyltransferase IRX9 [Malania oleifera]|uniref:beta-1,4-xylosyltransferase IRX9 n=1 Tax=Malania oleifera TaxID=397392 RepID=UPI0025ADC3A9|nr:beta-1,4-xylosyltransferase IRX9 [Malania oleifera]